jgi:hypothetical protein
VFERAGRRARFSRASSRCDFTLDRAVASRAYNKSIIGVGELAPKRGNVNDRALDGVLRRDREPDVGLDLVYTLQVTRGVSHELFLAFGPSVRC